MSSHWDAGTAILTTELTGRADVADVGRWATGLARELARIPDGSRFGLLLDLTGYESASLDAHRAMRTVVPDVLVRHGMRPAFVDLFPEADEPEVSVERGVECVAFANVHHDATKMDSYQTRIATESQRFFTRREDAEHWLRSVLSTTRAARGRCR